MVGQQQGGIDQRADDVAGEHVAKVTERHRDRLEDLAPPRTLRITDTGIGIAPEDLPRIFEKGYTGENGRADRKASGIGLYLCRRICGNLGIGLRAESAAGRGTTVLLDLPEDGRHFE